MEMRASKSPTVACGAMLCVACSEGYSLTGSIEANLPRLP
jgi:hypothetical protein